MDEPRPKKSTQSTKKAYRVIIIPTAAVGASALRKDYPKVISFTLPDQKAGTDFKGKFGEAADDPDETYRTLVTRVFNHQLAPFDKSVIDISSAPVTKKAGAKFMCSAVMKQESNPPEKSVKGGIIFFLASYFRFLTSPELWTLSRSCGEPFRPHVANLACFCRKAFLPRDGRAVSFRDNCSVLDG